MGTHHMNKNKPPWNTSTNYTHIISPSSTKSKTHTPTNLSPQRVQTKIQSRPKNNQGGLSTSSTSIPTIGKPIQDIINTKTTIYKKTIGEQSHKKTLPMPMEYNPHHQHDKVGRNLTTPSPWQYHPRPQHIYTPQIPTKQTQNKHPDHIQLIHKLYAI